MRAGVAQHHEAVGLVDPHRLDDVAIGQRVGEVAQFAVDPGHDDVALGSEQLGSSGLLSDRPLDSGDDDADAG